MIRGALVLHKVNENKEPLQGATFYLTHVETDGKESDVELTGADGVYAYKEAHSGLFAKSYVYATDATGNLKVTGLPYGTYKIYEKQAPAGYIKVDSAYECTIENPVSYTHLTLPTKA